MANCQWLAIITTRSYYVKKDDWKRGVAPRGCATLTPGCVLAPIQGAGGGDDWMLWGGCLGFAVSDGAEEGGDGDGDADSCDDAASVTDVCDG